MKDLKNIGYALMLVIAVIFGACEKQNLPETEPVDRLVEEKSEAYYANLRAYKNSDHQIYFGWFGGTGDPGSPLSASIYDKIPDSVDIVSLWGSYPPVGSHNHGRLLETQRVKGTKFLWCLFGSGVERLMIKNDSALYNQDKFVAIDAVAKSISDTIDKYGLDGFDLDYEPAFGDRSIFGSTGGYVTNDPYTQRLFAALGQFIGPQSGTEKILIIDGQSDIGIIPYIDYFMQQSYTSNSAGVLQSRITTFGGEGFPVSKFVPCEDFERFWEKGGVDFSDPTHGTLPSLLGFAYWNPIEGRKGGVGTYHTEYEYALNPDYKWTRAAIQIMNPAAN